MRKILGPQDPISEESLDALDWQEAGREARWKGFDHRTIFTFSEAINSASAGRVSTLRRVQCLGRHFA